jgi:hypothetical protein
MTHERQYHTLRTLVVLLGACLLVFSSFAELTHNHLNSTVSPASCAICASVHNRIAVVRHVVPAARPQVVHVARVTLRDFFPVTREDSSAHFVRPPPAV